MKLHKPAYSLGLKCNRRRWPLRVVIGLVTLLLIVMLAAGFAWQYYRVSLQPVSTSTATKQITIAPGALAPEIADQLYDAGLIRSTYAFLWYVKVNNASNKIMAGTYRLQPNLSIPEIVSVLTEGKVATDLVTILPGQRLSEIRQSLIAAGFSATAVDRALQPGLYKDNPALVSKPAGASLEGFLYPESFLRDGSTKPEDIIAGSLKEMDGALTADIRDGFAAQGLSTYEGITLASIVEQEATTQSDRDQVAQAFIARLAKGMRLESDVTAFYGAYLAGAQPSVTYASPYNTYIIDGLPPTPISNVSSSSLQAVAHPAKTDWLYFVAGDDGQTHFSRTLAEHEALTAQYCKKLCGN